MKDIVGRDKLRNFFEESGPEKVLKQTVGNLIAEGNLVVADGNIITIHKGKEEFSHFADFYKIHDGKIVSILSYMVMEKNPESNPESST